METTFCCESAGRFTSDNSYEKSGIILIYGILMCKISLVWNEPSGYQMYVTVTCVVRKMYINAFVQSTITQYH